MTHPQVIVVGAGLAGSLLATLLGQRNIRTLVLEARRDPRQHGSQGGRSINLALSTRGRTALARAGLENTVVSDGMPMAARLMHDRQGNLTRQPYAKDEQQAILSVGRARLNATLLDTAEQTSSVEIRFEQKVTGLRDDGRAVHVGNECLEADLIVGADGAGSVIRQSLEALKCCQSVTEPLGHAYKELELPPQHGQHALDPTALHIWPRGGEMAIALPNPDGTFTGTLFFANETFDRLQNEVEARAHLESHYRSMLQHVPDFEKQWSDNPVGFLGTLRVDQWYHGNTVLIGDAAHAIVPFYGQGMNAAFEDVRRLDELHAAGVSNLPKVLFEERKPNADAIAEMALMNFVEMRDHVGDPMFLNRKALERKLGRWLPKMFTPLYDRVSFSNQPYADALRHGKRQDQLLRRLQSLGLGR
jgi:kynurenine 3-monooxygenase